MEEEVQWIDQEGGTTLETARFPKHKQVGRRARSDRGSVRVSERDLELLELVSEQYAVTIEQLAWLIGGSHRAARGLRDRWRGAGWARSGKLAVGLPPFVWLTRRGSTLALSPYRVWEANAGLASHIEAVTNVRLVLERELGLGAWEM